MHFADEQPGDLTRPHQHLPAMPPPPFTIHPLMHSALLSALVSAHLHAAMLLWPQVCPACVLCPHRCQHPRLQVTLLYPACYVTCPCAPISNWTLPLPGSYTCLAIQSQQCALVSPSNWIVQHDQCNLNRCVDGLAAQGAAAAWSRRQHHRRQNGVCAAESRPGIPA